MIKLFVILSISLAVISALPPKAPVSPRIVDGKEIDISEVPYQVALMLDGVFVCGGAVINAYSILTAASCIAETDPTKYSIRAGSVRATVNGQVLKASKVLIHDKYDATTFDYDVAVVKLVAPLLFNDRVQPVQLADDTTDAPDGAYARIAGWGSTNEPDSAEYPETLLAIDIPIVHQDICELAQTDLTERMLCAGIKKQFICTKDLGGALVYTDNKGDKYHIGVASHGKTCDAYPGVYSRTASLRKFIDLNSKNDF